MPWSRAERNFDRLRQWVEYVFEAFSDGHLVDFNHFALGV